MRMKSIIASNMLGSVGGLTFLNNPYHQIVVRQRTVPVQPNTNGQVNSKVAFSSGVVAWEQASQATRDGWDAYAATVTFQGPLGPYKPSGRMLALAQYQITGYLNNQLSKVLTGGLSLSPPVSAGLLVMDSPYVVAPTTPGTGFKLYALNSNPEDVVAFASRSFQQSKARNYFKGPFDISTLDTVDIASTTSAGIEFLGLEDGGIYFVKLRLISDEAPRRYSQQIILRCVAQTTV